MPRSSHTAVQTLVYISEYHCFGSYFTVLTLFWHCMALFWHCMALFVMVLRSVSEVLRSVSEVLRSVSEVWIWCSGSMAVRVAGSMAVRVPGSMAVQGYPMGWALAIPRCITTGYYPTTPGTPPPTARSCMYPGSTCQHRPQRLAHSVKMMNSGPPIYRQCYNPRLNHRPAGYNTVLDG